jgi:predicted DsbA family dithiol-disulfide isomerase
MPKLHVEHFTDPACPFAFSAEPVRQRLKWHYGEQLVWHDRMIVLTANDPDEAALLASGAPGLQRRHGMPIDPAPRPRPASSEPASRAVVAARLYAPGAVEKLLRRLRVRTMAGGLVDDPELIRAALVEAGLSPEGMETWARRDDVDEALAADMRAARAPATALRSTLPHKLRGRAGRFRYSAPSYTFVRPDGGGTFLLPGFNAVEAYEAAIANLAPELERRPKPETVEKLLEWADEPLATAEVALIMQMDVVDVRNSLARVAAAVPAGADFYWVRDGAAVNSNTAARAAATQAVASLV